MPFSDQQYNDLKADRDRYAETAATLWYYLHGQNPTQFERQYRLGLKWEDFDRDMKRDVPFIPNFMDKLLAQPSQAESKLTQIDKIIHP